MKMRKGIIIIGLSTMIMFGGIVSAYAYTYVNGSSYQTVKYVDIPAWGHHKFNTYYGSKKMNSTTLGTFYKTWGQAALGNFGGFVTSSESSVSELVGLPTNKHNWASEHGTSKGGIYFTVVTSHSLEPANTCDLTLRFSADTLDLPN